MTQMVIETDELEKILKDILGVLTTLHQEEAAGLEQTSIRIEINALEAIAERVNRVGRQGMIR